MTNGTKNGILNKLKIPAVQPCRRMTGCCAVGSAPALGAGGREFESRHSDHKKSHDKALEIAFISWLYLLHIGLKMAGKCDRNATNSGKTCFVRQCAPLFCMPRPISYGCIMGYPRPCYGLGAVSNTDPIHKGMNQIHNPDTKKCQHRHKRRWGQSDGLHRSVQPAQNCAGSGCAQN